MELKPFQQTTLNAALGQAAFLNLDEQGTGKTVTQCFELARTGAKQNLIACPVVAMGVWEYHLKLLCPGIEVLRWPDVGSDCTTLITIGSLFENAHKGDPKKLVRVHDYLVKTDWEFFIIDEVHSIRNRESKQYKSARRIRSHEFFRGLSGTLIENAPQELWAPLNKGWPKDFSSYWRFFNEFVEWDEWYFQEKGYYKVLGPKNVERLRELLYGEGRAVRHLKKDVMPELPDKYYTYIPLSMSAEQARAYEGMRREALAWVGEDPYQPVPAPVMIAKMQRLTLFADGYAEGKEVTCNNLDPECKKCHGAGFYDVVRMREPSSKLDALMELLDTNVAPVVVFTVSTQLIHLAEARLKKAGYSYGIIEGSVSADKRSALVEQFQAGNLNVILCQTRAGGVAITLTRATTCIFLDRDWAPGANEQAEDRLHREGQVNAVQVIILQSKGTIDEYKEKKLGVKREWIRQILN